MRDEREPPLPQPLQGGTELGGTELSLAPLSSTLSFSL